MSQANYISQSEGFLFRKRECEGVEIFWWVTNVELYNRVTHFAHDLVLRKGKFNEVNS